MHFRDRARTRDAPRLVHTHATDAGVSLFSTMAQLLFLLLVHPLSRASVAESIAPRGRSHRSIRTGAPPRCIAGGSAGPCHPGSTLSINPFSELPPLRKVHHAWAGNLIERTVPGKPLFADGAFRDYVRITGSAPFDMGDAVAYGSMAADGGEAMLGLFVEAVQACVAAKQSSGREGVIALNYSPWQPHARSKVYPQGGFNVSWSDCKAPSCRPGCCQGGGPLSTEGESQELDAYRQALVTTRQYIANANANVSANVQVGAVILDSEVFFSIDPKSPPAVVAAVRRKNELIYVSALPALLCCGAPLVLCRRVRQCLVGLQNLTREYFPDPSTTTITYYGRGTALWTPNQPSSAEPTTCPNLTLPDAGCTQCYCTGLLKGCEMLPKGWCLNQNTRYKPIFTFTERFDASSPFATSLCVPLPSPSAFHRQ